MFRSISHDQNITMPLISVDSRNSSNLFNSSVTFFDPPSPPDGFDRGISALPLYLVPFKLDPNVIKAFFNTIAKLMPINLEWAPKTNPVLADKEFSLMDLIGSKQLATTPIVIQCYGAVFSSERTTEINQLAMDQKIDELQQLSNSDLEKIDVFALAREGKVETIALLLEREIEILKLREKGTGNTILHVAAECGQVDVLDQLRYHGIGLNSYYNNRGLLPVQLAILNGQISVLKFFDEHNITYDLVMNKAGDSSALSSLLHGATALHLAALSGNVEMLKHVHAKLKRPLNCKTASLGSTPLHLLFKLVSKELPVKNFIEVVNWFKTHGAELNEVDQENGATLAHYIAYELSSPNWGGRRWDDHYKECEKVLKELDFDLTIVDKKGLTPRQLFDKISKEKFDAEHIDPLPI